MAIPDYQALMLPVLTLAAEGEIRVPVAADVIADRLGLSDQDRAESSDFCTIEFIGPNFTCTKRGLSTPR
jgi:restriction endonuclease Mrr